MKRNLIGILSLVVLAVLFNATGAYAQSGTRANVPFAFTVGKAQLPAGSYDVTSRGQNMIMIRNGKTSAGAFSIVGRAYPSNASPRLVFHHVGSQYFLAQVWGEAGSYGLTIPTSRLEKELQVASGPSNANEEVVIALN